MRAKFSAEGNSVTLESDDDFGGRTAIEYFVPWGGGYVRIRDSAGRYPQVCEFLGTRGATLTATPDTLLDVIRHEYRAARAAERAEMREALNCW